jgi:hypothetical protein
MIDVKEECWFSQGLDFTLLQDEAANIPDRALGRLPSFISVWVCIIIHITFHPPSAIFVAGLGRFLRRPSNVLRSIYWLHMEYRYYDQSIWGGANSPGEGREGIQTRLGRKRSSVATTPRNMPCDL